MIVVLIVVSVISAFVMLVSIDAMVETKRKMNKINSDLEEAFSTFEIR